MQLCSFNTVATVCRRPTHGCDGHLSTNLWIYSVLYINNHYHKFYLGRWVKCDFYRCYLIISIAIVYVGFVCLFSLYNRSSASQKYVQFSNKIKGGLFICALWINICHFKGRYCFLYWETLLSTATRHLCTHVWRKAQSC